MYHSTMRNLKYVNLAGDVIILHYDGDTVQCYPATAGTWLPNRQPTDNAPPPETPTDPETPPETPDPPVSGPGWTHPLPGAVLTSGYGFRSGLDQPGLIHAGIDLSTTTAELGGWVLAPCDLEITQAIENGSGGFADAGSFVKGITRSGEPYTLSFFHMGTGTLQVSKGQKVSKGARLGRESQTGYSFGTHLHLEIWAGHITSGFRFDSPWYYGDGTPIDPIPVFRANGVNF